MHVQNRVNFHFISTLSGINGWRSQDQDGRSSYFDKKCQMKVSVFHSKIYNMHSEDRSFQCEHTCLTWNHNLID